MLIANFIGPKPKLGFLVPWMEALNNRKMHGQVFFNHEAIFGFFYLKRHTQETTKQGLMQTPSSKNFGTSVFHPWVPTLDAANLSSLRLPTWIINQMPPSRICTNVPYGSNGSESSIGEWSKQSQSSTSEICISITVEKRWAILVELTTLAPSVLSKALIDFDPLPIRCEFCPSTGHLTKECSDIPTKIYGSYAWAKPTPNYRKMQPIAR